MGHSRTHTAANMKYKCSLMCSMVSLGLPCALFCFCVPYGSYCFLFGSLWVSLGKSSLDHTDPLFPPGGLCLRPSVRTVVLSRIHLDMRCFPYGLCWCFYCAPYVSIVLLRFPLCFYCFCSIAFLVHSIGSSIVSL